MQQYGYTALVTMLIIAAGTLMLARSSAFLGMDELDMSYTANQGSDALIVAEGCLEEVVRQIQIDANYGLGKVPMKFLLRQGSCSVQIFSNGDERTIFATGNVKQFEKRIHAVVKLGSIISMKFWRMF